MMKPWLRFQHALRNLLGKPRVERQLDDELRAYVEMATDEKIAAGMPAAEARQSALAEFGGMEQVKQAVRDHRAGTGIELLWQDARYGIRQLRRNPGFTVTAVLTLGLGIGATTAIFSAVYSLLLRPLPYYDAGRLVSIFAALPKNYSDTLLDPDFVAARAQIKSFEQLAGFHISTEDNLTGGGDPMRVTRAAVTANFFSTLGVVPQLGNDLSVNEDWTGAPNVLLLSDRLWRNKFHADPRIVGRAVTLNGASYTVIGVLPRHFTFPGLYLEPDLYGPAVIERETTVNIEKSFWGIQPIARLRAGVSMEQAQAEIRTFFEARSRSYPPELANFGRERRMSVAPLQRHMVGDDRKPLLILLACVAAVLLISCANVANLQLARAVSRRHETALRGALGASRMRLIRQFLVESLVLSSIAALLGIAIAFVITSLVRHAGTFDGSGVPSRATQVLRLPFGKLSSVIQIDGWVLAFTVGLALVTTCLFGLAPAITGTRSNLRNALQSAAMRISLGREQRVLRHALLVMEVGLAVVLLSSASLLVRSFFHVMSYDAGFDAGNTLTGVTSLHKGVESMSGVGTAWARERYLNFADQVLLRLQALPGVKAAALTSELPLETEYDNGAIVPEGVPIPPRGHWDVGLITDITPDYFRAVGTPMLIGRAFDAADNQTAQRVAIVNRAFAKRFFAGDALGKRFKTNSGSPNGEFIPMTIVGIVDDVRHGGLEQEARPEAFRPMSQGAALWSIKMVLRAEGNPALLANSMRAAVTAVDAQQPVYDMETMEQRVSDAVAQRRLIMLLIACFAVLAVILSAVGVYGVFAYSVTQSAQEMGIRLALGASRPGLLGLVVMQATWLILAGGVLGLCAALVSSKLLASMLVGVTAHDAFSFSAAWALMTAVALIASTIPAAQAARTDLLSVLHSE